MIHPLSDVANTNIGNGTNIWQFCVVLPDAIIGSECNICSHCFIENKVRIGNNVMIGPYTIIAAANHPADSRIRSSGIVCGKPVLIADDVWIGAGCVVNPGVKIGEKTIIGSGSVVVSDIPPNVIAVGNPCHVIREII